MASINTSEADFMAVAGAARDAKDRGDMTEAKALDKIARKINAALSHDAPMARLARAASGQRCSTSSWKDMPSTLDP